jgi:hypothetical protein
MSYTPNCLITSIVANNKQYLATPADPTVFNAEMFLSSSPMPPVAWFIFLATTNANTFLGLQNQFIFNIQVLTNNWQTPNLNASFVGLKCLSSTLNSDGKTYTSEFSSFLH